MLNSFVVQITECITNHSNNLTSVDLHMEKHPNGSGDVFLCRIGFKQLPGYDQAAFEREFSETLNSYEGALATLLMVDGRRVEFEGPRAGKAGLVTVVRETGLPRMGILVSKTEHCVLELLRKVPPPKKKARGQ